MGVGLAAGRLWAAQVGLTEGETETQRWLSTMVVATVSYDSPLKSAQETSS